jgi:ABC-2 type transport system ATP-binding protein
MSASDVIFAEHLVKRYGNFTAVADISLSVRRGEIVGVLGPNGAGKTSTVEILEGLRKRDGGIAEVLGCDTSNLTPVRHRIGAVTQNGNLSENISVREHARFYGAIYPNAMAPDEAIERVGLTDKAKTRVSKLSGGQKQRLLVSLALIGRPEVVFLDEPTSELDPQARRLVWDLISDPSQRDRRAMLLTTHQMDEAQTLCDRVYIVDHGKIAAMDTPDALINRFAPKQTIRFETSLESTDMLKPLQPVIDGIRAAIETTALEDTLAQLMALRGTGAVVRNLSIHRATLEDVFLALTGRALRD